MFSSPFLLDRRCFCGADLMGSTGRSYAFQRTKNGPTRTLHRLGVNDKPNVSSLPACRLITPPPHRRTLSFAIGESDMTVRSWVQERIGHGQQSAPGWESDVRDPAAAVSGVRATKKTFWRSPPQERLSDRWKCALGVESAKKCPNGALPPYY